MESALTTVAAIIVLAIFYVLFPVIVNTFQRYRNKRVLICPETRSLAEVDIDVPRAALSSAFGKLKLEVGNCSLWPKKAGCDEGCLK